MNNHFALLAVIGMALATSAFAQGDLEFRATSEKATTLADQERATLFDKYAAAVERVQADFQTKGDLANALKARAEAGRAREQRVLGSGDIPGLEKLRGIMGTELDKIRLAETRALAQAREAYIETLTAQATALTKAGKLDEAITVSKSAEAEKIRLENEKEKIAALAGKGKPESILPPEPPAPEPGTPNTNFVRSPLAGKEPVIGDLVLEPGVHRLKDVCVVGRRGNNKETKKYEDIRGNVVSGTGVVITGGGIYLHNGTYKGTATTFDKFRLSEELQGKWTLKSCLLDDCEFKKDGGWGAGPYSAAWDFEDCVFDSGFFDRWTDIGLKITGCTFHNVKFLAFNYKEDAGKEAVSSGRRIKDCLFVDCTIPASTALATENCLFRNCRFTRDMGEDPVVETPIETVLYFDGDQVPEEPKLPTGARLVFKPLSEAGEKKFGSTVRYTLSRAKLAFE